MSPELQQHQQLQMMKLGEVRDCTAHGLVTSEVAEFAARATAEGGQSTRENTRTTGAFHALQKAAFHLPPC